MSQGQRARQTATRLVFLVLGWSVGAWAPMVPLVKASHGLDEARLGTLLLCLGLGSIVVLPFCGRLSVLFGLRRVLTASGLACAACLLLAVVVPGQWALAAALALLGASIGVTDVVVNIQAVAVEREAGRPLMSGFHGMFSVGGVAGSAVATALLKLGSTPVATTWVAVAAMVVGLVLARPGLMVSGEDRDGPAFALPRGRVLALGAMCFVLFMAEGSVTDWAAILLRDWRGWPDGAGLGYVAFAAMMTTGRLTGDRLVARVGRLRTVVLGSAVTALGFVLAAAVPSPTAGLVGFALVGAGASNVVPVFFTAAGNQRDMPAAQALPAVTTVGYLGFLAGPGLIGHASQAFTLPVALLMLATALLVVAVAAPAAMGRTLQSA
ncbi:MAG: MFS transporter [Fimbriimonadaceae bacterium]|nr:MFS transporter [Fimbriimonadaceae bacterium]